MTDVKVREGVQSSSHGNSKDSRQGRIVGQGEEGQSQAQPEDDVEKPAARGNPGAVRALKTDQGQSQHSGRHPQNSQTVVAQQRQYRDDEQAGRHQDDGDSTVGPPALGPVRLVMLAHPVIVTAGTRSRAARGRTLSP